MPASYGTVPFREQIEFFRRKLNLPTTSWTDVYAQEHDWAFVVAGANRDEIVADFRQAVQRAIEGGETLDQFRKNFDKIVAKHGWDYNGGRNWRSRVIYETNLRTSYAAGRYEQLQALVSVRPYWQYVHSDAVQNPRPHHLSWNGIVLRYDDPWWKYHFGPNGWGCQCTVRALGDRDLQRLGKAGPDTAPPIEFEDVTIGQRSPDGPRVVRVPKGVDPGFEYTPGAARHRSATPPERPDPPIPGSTGGAGLPNARPDDALPAPRAVPATRLLPSGLSEDEYLRRYLAEFGATPERPAIVRDVVGERVVVSRELFTDPQGALKIRKRDRERFLLVLADALKSPDEIWVRLEWIHAAGTAVVRRRYIARFYLEGDPTPLLVVFERGADGWAGVTAFQGVAGSEEGWRVGVRLYRRGDDQP
jgi:hypothetical protein